MTTPRAPLKDVNAIATKPPAAKPPRVKMQRVTMCMLNDEVERFGSQEDLELRVYMPLADLTDQNIAKVLASITAVIQDALSRDTRSVAICRRSGTILEAVGVRRAFGQYPWMKTNSSGKTVKQFQRNLAQAYRSKEFYCLEVLVPGCNLLPRRAARRALLEKESLVAPIAAAGGTSHIKST